MDASKERTLILWTNQLGMGECIESLQQLRDGNLLYKIAGLVDNDPQKDTTPETAEQLLRSVVSVLSDFYHGPVDPYVNFNGITAGDTLETAKICMLLLSAGMIRNNLFVEAAMRLDDSQQFEVGEMVNAVVQPDIQPDGIDASFAQVLMRSCNMPKIMNRGRGTSTPQHSGNHHHRTASTPVSLAHPHNQQARKGGCTPTIFSTSMSSHQLNRTNSLLEFLSPVTGPGSMCMSPVQQLIQSPGVSNKIMINRQEQKLKKLTKDLENEKHQRRELEAELKLREDSCDVKDNRLHELEARFQASQRQCKSLQSALESAQQSFILPEQPDAPTRRIRELQVELKDLRERNQSLDKENGELYSKLDSSNSKLNHLEMTKAEYDNSLKSTQSELYEMKQILEQRAHQMVQLQQALEQANNDLMRTTELYTEQLDANRRKNFNDSALNNSSMILAAANANAVGDRRETLAGVAEEILRDQLQSVQEELEQLVELKEQLETEKIELVQQRDTLAEEKTNIGEAWNQTKQEVLELQSKCSEWQIRTEQAEVQRGELDKQLQLTSSTLQATISELHQQVEQVEATLTATQQELKVCKDNASVAQAELKAQLEQASIQHQQYENNIAQVNGQVEQLNRELELAQQEFKTREAQLSNQLEEAVLHSEQMAQELEEKLTNFNQMEQSFNVKLQDAEHRHAETGRELTAKLFDEETKFQTEKVTLEEQLVQAEENINELKETHKVQFDEAVKRLLEVECNMNEQLERTKTDLKELEAKHQANMQEETTNHQNQMQQAQLRLEETEQNLNEMLETSRKQYTERELELKRQVEESYQKYSELEQSLGNELVKAEEKYKEMETKLTEEIKKAHADQVERYNTMENDLKAQIDNTQLKYKEAKAELISKCEQAEQKSKGIQKELDDTNNNHRQVVLNLNNQINEITQSNANLEKEFKCKVEELNGKLQEQENRSKSDMEEMERRCSDLGQMLNGELRNAHDKFAEAECRFKEDAERTLEQQKQIVLNLQHQLEESRQENERLRLVKERHASIEQDLDTQLLSLQGENERLDEELNAVIAAKVELEHQLSDAQDHADSATRDLDNLREDFIATRKELDSVNSRVSTAEHELEASIDREHNQASNIEHYKNELANIDKVHHEMVDQLKFHKEKVEQQQKSLTTYEQVVERMKMEIQNSREKETELTALLNTANDKEIELATTLKNSHEVQEQRKQTVAQAITQISKFEEELKLNKVNNAELQEKLHCYEERNNKLAQDLEEATRQCESLKIELTSSKEAFNSTELGLMQQIECTEAGRKELQKELDDRRNSLYHKQEHLTAVQDKVDMLKKELVLSEEHAKQSQAEMSVMEHKLDSLQTQLKEAGDALEKQQLECSKQVAAKEEELENVQQEMETVVEEYQQQVQKLQSEIESLKSQLDMLTSTKDSELDALHQELTCLNQQKQQDAQQISSLQNQVQIIRNSSSDGERRYHEEITKLQTELTTKESKLSEVERVTAGTSAEYEGKVRALEEQVEGLKSSNDNEKVSFCEEVRNLKEKLTKLSAESDLQLASKNASIQQLEKKVSELQEQLQNDEDQCTDLMASLATSQEGQAKLEADLVTQKRLTAQADEQSQELESALVELKEQFLTAQSRWNDQIKEFEEEKEKHQNTQKEKDMYTQRLGEVEQLLNQTKTELLDVQKKLQDKSCWEVSARANMIEMENEVTRLENEVKIKETTFGQKITELQTDLITVTNEKNQLQDTLDQTTDDSVFLQKELDGRQEKLETLVSKMAEKESKLRKNSEEIIMSTRKDMEQFRSLYEETRAKIDLLEKSKKNLESELQETLEKLESSQEENISLTDRLQEFEIQNSKVERDLQAHIERENSHLSKHQHEIQKASDMNKKIRQSLHQKEAELKELKSAKNKIQRELERMQSQMTDVELTSEREIKNLKREAENQREEADKKHRHEMEEMEKRYVVKLEESSAKRDELKMSYHSKLEETKEKYIKEVNREKIMAKQLKEKLDKVLDKGDLQSGRVSDLREDLKNAKKQLAHYQDETRRLDKEVSTLQSQLTEEQFLHKRLNNQLRSLEVQMEHANRQLKDKCSCGGMKSSVSTMSLRSNSGTPPLSRKAPVVTTTVTKNKKETTFDAAPQLEDSLAESTSKKYNLRSASTESEDDNGLSLEDLNSSADSFSVRTRRQSALSLAPSTGSEEWTITTPRGSKLIVGKPEEPMPRGAKVPRLSMSSVSSAGFEPTRSDRVPRGTGALFSMDDEPDEFEWNRLSELQRRNTLCLPHLKTSYPVEVQMRPPKEFSEKTLQKGSPIPEEPAKPENKEQKERRMSRKRRSIDVLDDSLDKLSIQGSAERKSSRRKLNDGHGLSTPGVKLYKHYSPAETLDASPVNTVPNRVTPRQRGRRNTPRTRTPGSDRKTRQQPKRVTPKVHVARDAENSNAQGKQPPVQKDSLAFNIGFTPKKNLRRLSRFIGKKPSSMDEGLSNTGKGKKKPLGDHNRR